MLVQESYHILKIGHFLKKNSDHGPLCPDSFFLAVMHPQEYVALLRERSFMKFRDVIMASVHQPRDMCLWIGFPSHARSAENMHALSYS